MIGNIKVAISADLFSAFSGLPKAQQSKVAKFITNFQKNPCSTGINYEKINDSKDPNMRSVRIDQAYRGIVLKPEAGNVYMLLWVDHHDAAYQWARRHRCDINAQTGAIQVFEVETASDSEDKNTPPIEVDGVFKKLKDRELMRMGVPEALLPMIRAIVTEDDLEAVSTKLPVEAYEGLFLYLAGASYEEIIKEQEAALIQEVDTGDFAAALERMATRSRFVVVDDEVELAAMLNAPLEKWRVFLHPSQRRLVEGVKNGAVRVLGGAGTGKTVVAMHRAKWLAKNVVSENQKVLFTTFTKNLATDIETNLSVICNSEELKKIEVINLDRWVSRFLRKHGYEYEILYFDDGADFWAKALDLKPLDLDFPDMFYKEEWQRVLQPQNIETLDQYKRASRIGRGTRLNRTDRVKIWTVFEEYRNLLIQNRKKEVDDAYRDAAAILTEEAGRLPYAAVIVDESQDMSTQAFSLIRNIVPEGKNDLFIVGDGHQRIYGRNKVVLSHCDINIRGRSRKLRINYRTTEEIRRYAVNLLKNCQIDDLDGGTDDNKLFHSLTHGDPPLHEQFSDANEQASFILEYVRTIRDTGQQLSQICIVARTRYELKEIQSVLENGGIEVMQIKANHSDRGDNNSVRLATMHRVKGLEFDEVIIASFNEGLCPLKKNIEDRSDKVEVRQADTEERSLVYVAMTRAKKKCLILSYGVSSPYVSLLCKTA